MHPYVIVADFTDNRASLNETQKRIDQLSPRDILVLNSVLYGVSLVSDQATDLISYAKARLDQLLKS